MSLEESQVISHVVADIDNAADKAITANFCLSIKTEGHISLTLAYLPYSQSSFCAWHRNKQLTTLI